MPTFKVRPRFWAVVLLLLFIPICAFAQGDPLAAVTARVGTLDVQRVNKAVWVGLPLRSSLYENDIARTGAKSRAAMVFYDGSEVRMSADSSLRIQDPAKSRSSAGFISVLAGEIWAHLRPKQKVDARYASLSVEGTEVSVTVDDTQAVLTVLDGQVRFFNNFGAVTVRTGQQSIAREGQAPTAPVTVANPGLIVEWTVDLNRALLPRTVFFAEPNAPRAAARLRGLPAPADFDAQLLRADLLFDSGDFDGALTAFQALEAGAPPAQTTGWRLGRREFETLLALRRTDEAEALVTAVLNPAPDAATTANANIALAWLRLAQVRPAEAETAARNALAALPALPAVQPVAFEAKTAVRAKVQFLGAEDADLDVKPTEIQAAPPTGDVTNLRGEANLALGVALLRQGKLPEARTAFTSLEPAAPAPLRSQAIAWQAIMDASNGEAEKAAALAELAVQTFPEAAFPHAAQALVAFQSGDSATANRAARRAGELAPDAIEAQLVLAQALWTSGQNSKARAAAARVVALDPSLAQGYYLLGIIDAGARDYRHSETELKRALQLDPGYAAAVQSLALVYTRQGHEKQARDFVATWKQTNKPSPAVLAALGEAELRSGQYDLALDSLRESTKQDPNSAFAWHTRCRAALEANRLNEAILAGQKAVALAPNIGTYHSVLGLTYKYAHLDGQADRSFRTGLALDPNNALALVQLGQLQKEGNSLFTQRNKALTYHQAFLLDPAISRDLLKPGTTGFVEPVVVDQRGFGAAARSSDGEGSENLYGELYDVDTSGKRPNSLDNLKTARVDYTLGSSDSSNFYFNYTGQNQRTEIPGNEDAPIRDDKVRFRYNGDFLGGKFRLGENAKLWLGLFLNSEGIDRENPDKDGSNAIPTPLIPAHVILGQEENTTRTAELRADFDLGGKQNNSRALTVGVAQPETSIHRDERLFRLNIHNKPPLLGRRKTRYDFDSTILYSELNAELGPKLRVAAEIQNQLLESAFESRGSFADGQIPLRVPRQQSTVSRTLPSLSLNYLVTDKTAIRLAAAKKSSLPSGSLLSPLDTQLNTEDQVLPSTYSSDGTGGSNTLELDVEHYASSGTLYKAFVFYVTGNDQIYDYSQFAGTTHFTADNFLEYNYFLFPRLRRVGLGGRIERPLTRRVFFQGTVSVSSTHATAEDFNPDTLTNVELPFSGQEAPYHPKLNALGALQYIDEHGNKAHLRLNYQGAFYEDDHSFVLTGSRPRTSGSVTADLLLFKEIGNKQEYYVKIYNLFDSERIIYNGIPFNQRQIQVGFQWRW